MGSGSGGLARSLTVVMGGGENMWCLTVGTIVITPVGFTVPVSARKSTMEGSSTVNTANIAETRNVIVERVMRPAQRIASHPARMIVALAKRDVNQVQRT